MYPGKTTNIEEWIPKTELGKKVLEGKITSMNDIFEKGIRIMEPEIVDFLLPDIDHELIMAGGSPGKGGGIRRTPVRRSARMHKSGRRYKMTVMTVVGNRNGYVGVGKAVGNQFGEIIEKSIKKAKLNIIPVRRGCGSWECECQTPHSLPAKVEGRSGSVRVILKPAPKGVGLVVGDEIKKVMQLAGIKDIWSETFGQTKTRINEINAVFNALKKLNTMKISEEYRKKSGLIWGSE